MPLSIGRPGSSSPARPERPPGLGRGPPNSAAGLLPLVAGPSDCHSFAATAAPPQPPAGRCSPPEPGSAADRGTTRWAPPSHPVAPQPASAPGPAPAAREPALAPVPSSETEFPTKPPQNRLAAPFGVSSSTSCTFTLIDARRASQVINV